MSELARAEHRFFAGMSLAILITVFVGFAPTYYLKTYFQGPSLPLLIHAHGLAFTVWIVLFAAQTALAARRRMSLHRRLGLAGAYWAGTMVVVGLTAAIVTARRNYAAGDTGVSAFLVIPFGDLFVFGVLVAAGIWYRHRGDVHKRLMLLATLSVLGAALARWPFPIMESPAAYFAAIDLMMAAGVAFDLWARRRIHPAFIAGGLFVVLSQPLRLALAGTTAWLAFADAILK